MQELGECFTLCFEPDKLESLKTYLPPWRQDDAGWLVGSIRGGPRRLVPSNYVIPLGGTPPSATLSPFFTASSSRTAPSSAAAPADPFLPRRSPTLAESRPPDLSAPLSTRTAAAAASAAAGQVRGRCQKVPAAAVPRPARRALMRL